MESHRGHSLSRRKPEPSSQSTDRQRLPETGDYRPGVPYWEMLVQARTAGESVRWRTSAHCPCPRQLNSRTPAERMEQLRRFEQLYREGNIAVTDARESQEYSRKAITANSYERVMSFGRMGQCWTHLPALFAHIIRWRSTGLLISCLQAVHGDSGCAQNSGIISRAKGTISLSCMMGMNLLWHIW